jgi:hypothetical protein
MNTPVTFEVAKLLKEKGFDNATGTHYWLEDELNPEIVYSKTPRQEFFKEYGGSLLAPTIAEVVMWLYEKHGIWIEVNHIKTFGINRFHITIWNYKDTSDYITIYHDGVGPGYKVWDSPTEAYLSAIDYTLNNLI